VAAGTAVKCRTQTKKKSTYRQEKVPQESNSNVFLVVTCVRVDGWAFEVQKKRTNEWKLFKYSFEKGKV
jgi:hypothetical protein